VDSPTTNWKCGIRGNSDRGFESLSLRQIPCTVRLLGIRELRPGAAIGRITTPTLTPTMTPFLCSANVGGRPWTGYRISAQSAALADQPEDVRVASRAVVIAGEVRERGGGRATGVRGSPSTNNGSVSPAIRLHRSQDAPGDYLPPISTGKPADPTGRHTDHTALHADHNCRNRGGSGIRVREAHRWSSAYSDRFRRPARWQQLCHALDGPGTWQAWTSSRSGALSALRGGELIYRGPWASCPCHRTTL
jgi:hypothetical protein